MYMYFCVLWGNHLVLCHRLWIVQIVGRSRFDMCDVCYAILRTFYQGYCITIQMVIRCKWHKNNDDNDNCSKHFAIVCIRFDCDVIFRKKNIHLLISVVNVWERILCCKIGVSTHHKCKRCATCVSVCLCVCLFPGQNTKLMLALHSVKQCVIEIERVRYKKNEYI